MKNIRFILFFILFPISLNGAVAPGSEDHPAIFVTNTLLSQTFPNTDMSEGKWELNVSPVYFSYDTPSDETTENGEDFDSNGLGVVVRLNYTLFETDIGSFGFGGNGGYFKGDGTGVGIEVNNSTTSVSHKGDNEFKGGFVSVYAIMDLFKKFDTFGIPMYIGLSYITYKDELTTSTTIPTDQDEGGITGAITATATAERDTVAAIAGMAPQKDFGDFRGRGIAIISKPFSESKYKNTFSDSSATGTSNKAKDRVVGALGLELIYRPWNFGGTYIPPLITRGTTLFSLSWSKTF